jgi:GNAT superfamily N-acetyltransferase
MKVEPLQVGGAVIEEIDVRSMSDEDIVRLNAFGNILRDESYPEDPAAPVELTRARVRNIPDFIAIREFWAREADGSIAATADIAWEMTEDNKHLARTDVNVRPDHRGRGIAKTLLGLLAAAAEAEGRTLMMGGTHERVPSGEAFARRVGAETGQEVHTNRLLVADVDRDMVDRWVERGPLRAEDYRIIALEGVYPDELAEAILACHHIMNTAPRDGLEIEDEHWTVEQMRQWEKSMLASGTERWSLFARHDPSGELVGFTEVGWQPAQPETVWQWATAVRPDHRGHALGKWLKAAMLQRVLNERPDVLDVRTGNADSNDAMLGINHALGFKPYVAATFWQVTVDQVRSYLNG